MKKRGLSLMLAMVMCLGMLPTAVMAADDDLVITEITELKYRFVKEYGDGSVI